MSDSSHPRAASSSGSNCPTCGTVLPPSARFCPNCGTRMQPGPTYDPDEFRTAVDDVLDDREQAADDRSEQRPDANHLDTIQIPATGSAPPFDESPMAPVSEPVTISANPPSTEASPPTWTTTPNDRTIQTPPSPPSAAPSPPRRRENRTLWIILAIFGGIVFCCCALFFLLFAVSSADSSFQSEISMFASVI